MENSMAGPSSACLVDPLDIAKQAVRVQPSRTEGLCLRRLRLSQEPAMSGAFSRCVWLRKVDRSRGGERPGSRRSVALGLRLLES